MYISKSFNFDAAHRLHTVSECHPCRAIHGHRYSVEIKLRSDFNKGSMIMDYRVLTDIVTPYIKLCDHATMVAEDDKELYNLVINNPNIFRKVVFFSAKETTAENIASLFQREIALSIANYNEHLNFLYVSVAVSETPSSRAETSEVQIKNLIHNKSYPSCIICIGKLQGIK